MPDSKRVLLQSAFVIHRRPYRETSVLMEVFSRDYGKVSLLAKGVRKAKSAMSAVLQPFSPLRLSWMGRSQLQTLTAAEIIPPAIQLGGRSLYCGFYLNELLVRFLHHHDPHKNLFSYYAATLLNLRDEEQMERCLRYFEVSLLEEVGFGLQLDVELDSGCCIEPGKLYNYLIGQGPVEVKSAKNAIHGATLIGLRERNLVDKLTLREAKQLMRTVIDSHLNGKPLLSRSLFQSNIDSA